MQDLDGRVVLDSIICLVDATSFSTRLIEDVKILAEQLEFADFVMVNKMDLVGPEVFQKITEIIRRVNAFATIVPVTHGEVDMRYVFDTHRFSLTPEMQTEFKEYDEVGHTHDSDITQFVYESSKKFQPDALKEFIDTLDNDVFRIKGFVQIEGHGSFLLQRA